MANYLEHLASPSTNTVTVPAVLLPAANWVVRVKFRIPAGVTGDVNLFGEESNTNNRFFVNPTTGRIAFRSAGTVYNSNVVTINNGTICTVEYQRVGSQTLIKLNGTTVTTLGYVVTMATPFTRLGSSSTSRTRVDLYQVEVISSTVNMNWNADGVTSGTVFPDLIAGNNGVLTNFAGNPWKAEATINTISNPIPADGAFSGTATGYTSGAATLTTPLIGGGTVSASVTIASGTDPLAFTGTYPPPVSTQVYPIMGVSHVHALTQAVVTATQGSVVGAPAGYTIVPLNFPVTDNPQYITANLIVTPVTGDLLIHDSADITVDPSGFWTAEDPTVTIVIHQVLLTGVVYIYEFTLDEGGVIDNTPNSFTFTAVTNANISNFYTSNEVTIAGLGSGVNADLTVVGGLYSKNDGAFTSDAGVIANGDTLKLRRASSASYSTAVNVDVTVGTYTTTYSITTKVDNDPDNIKFVTLSALSNIETIEGVTGSVPISITGGQYSKNSGAFTSTAGTVVNTDTIQLSAANGATVTVTIGSKTFSWSSVGSGNNGIKRSIIHAIK
jgi:hypothetical protein